MTTADNGSLGFEDVDSSSDPTAAVRYLDQVTTITRNHRSASYGFHEIHAGHRFLDVGCGAGDVLIEVAERIGPTGRVCGIDLANTMIQMAQSRLWEAGIAGHVEQADAYQLPFGDASFDRVRIERVLQHLEDPARALAEIHRVLAPDGMVLALESNHEQTDVATGDVEIWPLLRKHGSGHVHHPRAGVHLPEWLTRAGFKDVRLKPTLGAIPWPPFRMANIVDEAGKRAIAAGELTPERFQMWLDEQDARHEAGTFCGVNAYYSCLGTKRVAAARQTPPAGM